MRPLYFLALILLTLLAPDRASAAAGRCTTAQARPTTIETVRDDYRTWGGRCVRLRGVAVDRRLYADRTALVEVESTPWSGPPHSIPLTGRILPGDRRKPRWIEAIGVIDRCADQYATVHAFEAEHPGEIVMLGGFCHTSLEVFIRPIAIRILSARPIPRLTEAEVPEAQRELVGAPADLPGMARYRAAARAIAVALATGDEAAFRRLGDPDLQHDLDGLAGAPTPETLDETLRETHAAFAARAGLGRRFAAILPLDRRQERVLVNRADLETYREEGRQAPSSFVVCWCTAKTCAGRWPVRSFDADNLVGRPYLCARTNDYQIYKVGPAIQAQVDAERAGFAEPAGRRGRPPG